jgi:prepilin-type N-terminal cleavage/methylation domain-containing protein
MRRAGLVARPGTARIPGAEPDGGFTLIEVLVSVSLIAVVMAALTASISSMRRVSGVQSGQQTAAELATDGIETALAKSPADLLADPPSDPAPPRRGGVAYTRTWSVTRCWQPPGGGDCGAQLAGYVPLLRVAVTVTWPERGCAATACSYATTTLVSAAPGEPLFAPS